MTWKDSVYYFFARLAGLALFAASLYVLGKIGLCSYAIIAFIFLCVFGYLYNFRWTPLMFPMDESEKRDSERLIYSAVFWPAAIVYFPAIFIRKERERKERMIREIMDS
jgi:hypothetical protein